MRELFQEGNKASIDDFISSYDVLIEESRRNNMTNNDKKRLRTLNIGYYARHILAWHRGYREKQQFAKLIIVFNERMRSAPSETLVELYAEMGASALSEENIERILKKEEITDFYIKPSNYQRASALPSSVIQKIRKEYSDDVIALRTAVMGHAVGNMSKASLYGGMPLSAVAHLLRKRLQGSASQL